MRLPEAGAQNPNTVSEPRAKCRQPVLTMTGLRTYFHTPAGLLKAVDGVSLEVCQGETLALVGESGSGKSVTGLSLMRLLGRTPARIAGGTALFYDHTGTAIDVLSIDEERMRTVRGREMAMIFQDPTASLNPVFPIGEQIEEALRLHLAYSRGKAHQRACELLAQVGIADPERRARAYPHELSGGMRQRVMIALAICCNPRLLIADEPTTALDVTIQAQIIARLKALQAERDMAMIFVTHDLKLVEEVADRAAVMYAGHVVEEGAIHDILNHSRHPYTRALIACIPKRKYGATNRQTFQPIPGALPSPLTPPEGCRFHPRCTVVADICRQDAQPALEQTEPGHRTACIRWRELT